MGGPPPPPPLPGMGGPPPPPPLPGMGGPPPPPPLPGMGGPPPPPPLPGMGPPPPPGMGGPPPPFPGAQRPPQLPYGMKEKRKYKVDAPMKRINWSKIPVIFLKENSFWVRVDEQKYASEDFTEFLIHNFSTKKAKVVAEKSSNDQKKGKSLRFIDEKQSQALSITLRAIKGSNSEIGNWFLQCNMEKLEEHLENLLKSLPEDKIIQDYGTVANSYSELDNSEQFLVEMSKIKGIRKRIESLIYKLKFPEQLENTKKVNFHNKKVFLNF
jgi:diaphanous 2